MKKVLRITSIAALAAAGVGMLAGCGAKGSGVKMALICLHGESSTYDKNFIDAFKAACKKVGATYDIKTGVPEGNECAVAAKEYAEDGYDIVFADSFGHEAYMMEAARAYPDVQFCHATGTQAHTANLPNFHNAFASIYEGRYLAGVTAGLKLQEMIENEELKSKNYDADGNVKLGYVGAFPYAEVKSGYTSWFLGVRSVVENVAMQVTFTNSWYDLEGEKSGAETLIANGCAIISQHADSMGAPGACETAMVPNVAYNGSTGSACPETYLVSSKINWAPYFEYIHNCVLNEENIVIDYTGTFATDSVQLSEFGKNVAAGTAEKIEQVKSELIAGTRKVFDTSKFTVDGQEVTSYLADVDDDGTWTGETEVIANGEFQESKYRSAPYFDLNIDGITLLN